MTAVAKYFPKLARVERCHPSFATASCHGRREAVRHGEFFWDWNLGGWVSIMNPLRTSTWHQVWKSGENHNGQSYVLEICPWCGSALPELTLPYIVDCGEDSRTT